MTAPVQPILVMMSWRGGERLQRCLDSIARTQLHFKRVVLSITGTEDCDDMHRARAFQQMHPNVEVICTGRELPTLQHQAYWVSYLQDSGVRPGDWIYWLAYDDEVRASGIDRITDASGNWSLQPGTAYFGPWAMRHESPDALYAGPGTEQLESWTSFPAQGPTRLKVAEWIARQLRQPTYMQMSGSICSFATFIGLRDDRPRKRGPMRIEMAAVATPSTTHVEEFPEPVSIIYGRSNSDRASYGRAARREDVHLVMWLGRYAIHHPGALPTLGMGYSHVIANYAKALATRSALPAEEWRVRGSVTP